MNKSFLKYCFIFFLTLFLFLIGFLFIKNKRKPIREAEVFFTAPIADEVIFHLSPELESFSIGQSFSAKVKLATTTTTKVVIATAVLNFDKNILKVNSISGSNQFSNKMKIEYDNNTGVITIKQGVGGGDPAVSGDIEFAVIEFQTKSAVEEALVQFDESNSSAVSDEAEYLDKSFYGASYEISENGGGKEADFYLDPAVKTTGLGETFESIVKLRTEEDIVIATAVLNFDKNILKVNSISGSNQFSNKIETAYGDETGIIIIKQGVGGGDPAVSGDIEFAVIEFIGINLTDGAEVIFNEQDSSVVSDQAEYLIFETTGARYSVFGGASPSPSDEPECKQKGEVGYCY